MSLPIVAIVGRPNVGKSTLFNKLIGQRLSIVEDTPGVTRDRIYAKCEWLGHEFMLVDTGGIEPESDDIILAQMRRQAELAVKFKGEHTAMAECRRMCAFYLRGIPSAAKFRNACGQLSSLNDLYALIGDIKKVID